MLPANYLTDASVLLHPPAESKEALLRALTSLAMKSPALAQSEYTEEQVFAAIMKREQEQVTLIGNGVAAAHTRLPGFRGVAFGVAILDSPLEYGGSEPVQVVMLFVAPSDVPPVSLKLLANIASIASTPEHLSALMNASTAAEAAAFLRTHLADIDVPIRARDVMRPPLFFVTADTRVDQMVHTMLAHQVESAGIVDDAGRLVGEISADRIFTLGMPEFFQQLKSVSFISEFDPFEKYFEHAAYQTVGTFMTTDYAEVPEDATIIEVIFHLAVRRQRKVFVTRDGLLVGVIDRLRVLDVILNI